MWPLVFPFSKYLLRTGNVPGIGLGAGDTAVTKVAVGPALAEFKSC